MQKIPNLQKKLPYGLYYDATFLDSANREKIVQWLSTLHPIWEERYSKNNPPPANDQQRWLLRPVYWLGNWQFACLNYYHPPKGTLNRCVAAEPFPDVLNFLVARIEKITRKNFLPKDIPKNWRLNTCLINMYGSELTDGKNVDVARVGEHRDYEPGPVASLSLGERAFFQFVSTSRIGQRHGVVFQQWLEDRSLQVFAGPKWKDTYFHRVQRVEKKGRYQFQMPVENFSIRRINFTFRYVPKEHVVSFSSLPVDKKEDVFPYIQELAVYSDYYKKLVSVHDTKS